MARLSPAGPRESTEAQKRAPPAVVMEVAPVLTLTPPARSLEAGIPIPI
jgi:hypothetical protein